MILNSLFQLTIKDVSFDSSLKSNVHWTALFSYAFKGGDSNLKSGPFGCGFMDEIKDPQSSGVFRKIKMLLALILSMIICTFCLWSGHLFWVFIVSVDFYISIF